MTNETSAIHRPAIPEADLRILRQAVDQHTGIDADDKARMQTYLTPRDPEAIPEAGKPRVYRLGDLLGEFDEYAAAAHEAYLGNKPLGIRTGLPSVDKEIGEVFQPGLHSIHANTGAGKTALALQIAATCGFPALYVTCEMPPLELLRRITARVSSIPDPRFGIYVNTLRDGRIPPEKAGELVRKAIATCPDLAILDARRGYTPAFGPDPMNLYDQMKAIRGDSPHVCVVIDSLHSWANDPSGAASEYEILNAAIKSLAALAAALTCPVLYISEMNRGSMNAARQGQDPGVNSGAGTRKIEYQAESVISLTQTKDTEDSSGEIPVVLRLEKNRYGMKGKKIDLRFSGGFQRFREV